MSRDLCKICGQSSMVMAGDNSKKVPYRMARDAKSFICSSCILRGALKPKVTQPEKEHFDLKVWRKSKGLTQSALAEMLQVGRSMIAKVETGDKLIPASWEPFLAKM